MPTKEKTLREKVETHERFQEFKPIMQRMMTLITDIESKFSSALSKMEDKINRLADQVKADSDTTLKDLKKKSDEGFQGDEFRMLKADIKKMEQRLNDKIASVRDGKDGKPGMRGEPGKTPDALEIQNALRPFMEKTQKEQEEALKKIQQRAAHSGRARRIPIMRAVNLTSDVDGQRRTFTLPRDTTQIFFGISSQFPFALHVTDLTLSGNEVTLHDTVPTIESGQTLVIFVEVLFHG